jgi:hypothetical protein
MLLWIHLVMLMLSAVHPKIQRRKKENNHDASELRLGNNRISETYHRGHRTGSAMNRESVLVYLYDHVVRSLSGRR